MDSIFNGFSAIDDEFYEEIEEILIMGDLGIQTTTSIMEDLRKKVKEQNIKDPSECKQLLMDSIMDQMDLGENAYEFEKTPLCFIDYRCKTGWEKPLLLVSWQDR